VTNTQAHERLVSALLCEKVIRCAGSLGVVVQDVPYLQAAEVIAGLARVLESVDLRIAVLTPDAESLAEEAGIPPEKFSATVQQAEVWRNDRSLAATIVVVPFGDQARLSSLQEFETIGPAVLKGLLVAQAQAGLADTNDVLLKWWSRLATDRNISFGQLVDYYVALPSGQDNAADFKAQSSRQLPRLGLLSDPELFDSAREPRACRSVADVDRRRPAYDDGQHRQRDRPGKASGATAQPLPAVQASPGRVG
jgi:hypothetical protein